MIMTVSGEVTLEAEASEEAAAVSAADTAAASAAAEEQAGDIVPEIKDLNSGCSDGLLH